MIQELKPAPSGKKILFSLLFLCAAAAIAAGAVYYSALPRYEPPVIQGVQAQVVVIEDEDIPAALLQGVSAVGGPDRPEAVFPVTVTAYDQSGREAGSFSPGTYRLVYRCEEGGTEAESVLIVQRADTQPPVITGAQDIAVEVGQTVSYRSGVAVTDNFDPSVQLQVDASRVNLNEPGDYPLTYSAADSRGNRTSVSVTVTVMAAAPDEPDPFDPEQDQPEHEVTQEQLEQVADRILAKITSPGMTQRQTAKAIYDYVHRNIRYVGTSDKSSWIRGAYVGLTRGRGDCYNYFAASKALLTRAGIPNVDLYRVGGSTDHYWQLVDVGGGYYHFDACPHPNGYPINSFLITEAEARAYTEQCQSRTNYYVYDYASCPVTVVGTPAEPEDPGMQEQPADPENPGTPEQPADPENPGTPELPADPENPGTQELPADPENPGTPELPADPENPGTQEQPADPENPGTQEQPADPENPGTQELPVQPEPSGSNSSQAGEDLPPSQDVMP